MKTMMVIRGATLHTQLRETTYQELERQTLTFVPPTIKRQFSVDPIQITQLQLTPSRESETLQAHGVAQSAGHKYDPTVLFTNVLYDDGDQPDNITFVASDGEEYYIDPILLARSNCKVGCNCLDFYWRFAVWNATDDSLLGTVPGPYVKTTNRPPVNPRRVSGVCKHIMKLIIALKDAGLVR